jgi:ABC-type uncharacterized transport system ATPase subunit
LSEIEQLCSHLAVMTAGKIVAQGSLAELRNESQTRLVLKADRIDELVDFLKTQGLTKLSLKPDRVVAPVPSDFDVASLNQLLVKKKFMVSEIRLEQPSLEEYFVNLTGEGFEVVR